MSPATTACCMDTQPSSSPASWRRGNFTSEHSIKCLPPSGWTTDKWCAGQNATRWVPPPAVSFSSVNYSTSTLRWCFIVIKVCGPPGKALRIRSRVNIPPNYLWMKAMLKDDLFLPDSAALSAPARHLSSICVICTERFTPVCRMKSISVVGSFLLSCRWEVNGQLASLLVAVSAWQNLCLRFLFSVVLNLTQLGFTYGSVLMAFKTSSKTVV